MGQTRMVEGQFVLAVALLIVPFIVGVWDVVVVSYGSPQDTVSNLVGEWSQTFPVLPLAVGIVVGHIFWPRHNYPH